MFDLPWPSIALSVEVFLPPILLEIGFIYVLSPTRRGSFDFGHDNIGQNVLASQHIRPGSTEVPSLRPNAVQQRLAPWRENCI